MLVVNPIYTKARPSKANLALKTSATVGILFLLLPPGFRSNLQPARAFTPYFVWKGETKPVAGLQRHPLIDPIFWPTDWLDH